MYQLQQSSRLKLHDFLCHLAFIVTVTETYVNDLCTETNFRPLKFFCGWRKINIFFQEDSKSFIRSSNAPFLSKLCMISYFNYRTLTAEIYPTNYLNGRLFWKHLTDDIYITKLIHHSHVLAITTIWMRINFTRLSYYTARLTVFNADNNKSINFKL